MTITDLLAAVPGSVLLRGQGDREVGAVRDSDAEVAGGDLFVAVRGARVDMHDRLMGLAHAGALVVDRECQLPGGPAVIRVDDTRRALPHLCARALGNPGAQLPVVAVTGTNGKTSTTFLVAAMARAAGLRAGIIGTTGHFVDDERLESTHTTPTAPVTQALLARMRSAGVGLVAMEASSIGLAAYRCDAIPFRAAGFTNLTRDHLDVHGTMAAYAAAKGRLFHELLQGTAVLNARDPVSRQMVPEGHTTWWFHGDDLSASAVQLTATGTRALFHTPHGDFDGGMKLVGAHNIDNALAALGLALAAGIPLDACARGLAELPAVPGRLEAVPNARGLAVLVDYAHTDDALARVLATLRQVTEGRIITVFGCGGDRDRGKRPLMGRAAALGSDVVVVTTDNPRGEDPAAIVADILPGLGTAPHRVVLDRREAIAVAVGLGQPGDVVLIAGKGHEPYQEIMGERLPFDDRAVAREVLS